MIALRVVALIMFTGCLFLDVAAVAGADASSDYWEPAIALVRVYDANGTLLRTGSAFCISSDSKYSYFVTAEHVVHNADHADLLRIQPKLEEWDSSKVSIPYHGTGETDVAVIRVERTGLRALKLNTTALGKLHTVVAGGFPASTLVQISQGHLPGVEFSPGDVADIFADDDTLLLGLVPAIEPGSSGGPLLDKDSNGVVGMIVSQRDVGIYSVDYALPISRVLLPFLNDNHIAYGTTATERASGDIADGSWSLIASSAQSVTFGGQTPDGFFCTYEDSISPTGVTFNVVNGAIGSASVQLHFSEKILSVCPFEPLSPRDQELALVPASFSVAGGTVDFALSGKNGDEPQVNASFHGVVNGNGIMSGSFLLHRVDTTFKSLNWTVPTDVTLRH